MLDKSSVLYFRPNNENYILFMSRTTRNSIVLSGQNLVPGPTKEIYPDVDCKNIVRFFDLIKTVSPGIR